MIYSVSLSRASVRSVVWVVVVLSQSHRSFIREDSLFAMDWRNPQSASVTLSRASVRSVLWVLVVLSQTHRNFICKDSLLVMDWRNTSNLFHKSSVRLNCAPVRSVMWVLVGSQSDSQKFHLWGLVTCNGLKKFSVSLSQPQSRISEIRFVSLSRFLVRLTEILFVRTRCL